MAEEMLQKSETKGKAGGELYESLEGSKNLSFGLNNNIRQVFLYFEGLKSFVSKLIIYFSPQCCQN